MDFDLKEAALNVAFPFAIQGLEDLRRRVEMLLILCIVLPRARVMELREGDAARRAAGGGPPLVDKLLKIRTSNPELYWLTFDVEGIEEPPQLPCAGIKSRACLAKARRERVQFGESSALQLRQHIA